MKKFFVRIGFYFLCLFLMNLFFIIAGRRSAGAIFAGIAIIIGEMMTRAVLDKDKKAEDTPPESAKKGKNKESAKTINNKWDALELKESDNDQEDSE